MDIPNVRTLEQFNEKVRKMWQMYNPKYNKDLRGHVIANLDDSTKVIQFRDNRNETQEVEYIVAASLKKLKDGVYALMTKSIDDSKITSSDKNVQRAEMNRINLITLNKNKIDMDTMESLGHEISDEEFEVVKDRIRSGQNILEKALQ